MNAGQSGSIGRTRVTVSRLFPIRTSEVLAVARTKNLGAALPRQDRMCLFGIIGVVTRYIPSGALCVCVCVYVCVFITAVPITKLLACGEGDSGGSVL